MKRALGSEPAPGAPGVVFAATPVRATAPAGVVERQLAVAYARRHATGSGARSEWWQRKSWI